MKRTLILFAYLLTLAGCVQMPFNNPWATTSAEQTLEKELDIGTVGDVTDIANAGVMQVSGVGLVIGLDGTGGSPVSGDYRKLLEQQLRQQKVENTKSLIDSPNNAMVLVTAFIHAGIRKGELIDVEVVLPPGSKATSLKGGTLAECPLRNFESTRNISPESGTNSTLLGHVLAKAKGTLIVGLGNPDNEKEIRRGRIWSGANSLVERPFYLILNKEDKKTSRIANSIADRINLQFQDDPRKQRSVRENRDLMLLDGVTKQLNRNFDPGLGKGEMAKAINKEMITLRVPFAYHYNHERFLRVARLLPLGSGVDGIPKYRDRLQTMLLDPKQTLRASLRLEALGKESIPILKLGLSSEEPLVRFASAESLAYLGSTAGIEELAKLAVNHPELRAYALVTLAGLDESICRSKLGDIMTIDDPELRSGAFRALHLLDENDSRLHEEAVGNQFFLHKVAPGSASLVTFAVNKRAEIVLFGPAIPIVTPVKVLAGGEFTVTAEADDDRVTVSRVTVKGVQRKQCPLLLEDVLRSMVELGADYAEIVDLLKNFDEQRAVACRIRENAPPSAGGLESLMATDFKEARLPIAEK